MGMGDAHGCARPDRNRHVLAFAPTWWVGTTLYDLQCSPLFDPDGSPLRMMEVARTISENIIMKRNNLVSIVLGAGLVFSACPLPGSAAADSSAVSTSAALTVQAVLSTPTATQPPAVPPTATSPACEDNAQHTTWTRDGVTYDVNEVNK